MWRSLKGVGGGGVIPMDKRMLIRGIPRHSLAPPSQSSTFSDIPSFVLRMYNICLYTMLDSHNFI